MKINWKVRIKNPLWWVQIAAALLLPMLAYFGLAWEDMTSWGGAAGCVASRNTESCCVAVGISQRIQRYNRPDDGRRWGQQAGARI